MVAKLPVWLLVSAGIAVPLRQGCRSNSVALHRVGRSPVFGSASNVKASRCSAGPMLDPRQHYVRRKASCTVYDTEPRRVSE